MNVKQVPQRTDHYLTTVYCNWYRATFHEMVSGTLIIIISSSLKPFHVEDPQIVVTDPQPNIEIFLSFFKLQIYKLTDFDALYVCC